MTRIPIDLIKANLFGIGSRRVERDGTGDERKAQEALTRWLAKQAGFSDEQARWIADGWVSIRPKSGQKIVDAPDFRDELQMKKYPAGIVLDVNVSDSTKDPKAPGWSKIGEITLKESIVSYGCDCQLHFHHPKAHH